MTKNRNTLFVGGKLFHFSSLPSTNDYAIELLARSKPAEGTVISTYNQTHGRGQFGTTWEVAPNVNIAFTTILYPGKVPPHNQFLLNQAISISVVDLLRHYTDRAVHIKWPNDIYLEEKKVCGILIQNSIGNHRIQSSVIGIGLNVNQLSFPPHLPKATSLGMEEGKRFDLDEIRDTLCQCLEQRYLALLNNRFEGLKEAYGELLFKRGRFCWFKDTSGRRWEGRVEGVSPEGLLRLKSREGAEIQVQPKQLEWI